jgi:hypothetical protein
MDVLFFLKERTNFIRFYYDAASKPFCEIKRKIEEREPPFDNPPDDESGEPPNLEDWTQADEAQEILGRTCISMPSASLQLYFKTWEDE